jgi:(p)ppGpp synthase/HD superfamily hydrolase
MNEPPLKLAIEIAAKAHAGQYDKQEQPYIQHPIAVMWAVEAFGDEAKMVAVLHDVVEDTSVTLDDLRQQGIPEVVVVAVDAISKRKGESYETYLSRVQENDLAFKVKVEDIKHNLSRMKGLPPREVEYLTKKYARALHFFGIA